MFPVNIKLSRAEKFANLKYNYDIFFHKIYMIHRHHQILKIKKSFNTNFVFFVYDIDTHNTCCLTEYPFLFNPLPSMV